MGETRGEGRVEWAVANAGVLAAGRGEEGSGEVICEVACRV